MMKSLIASCFLVSYFFSQKCGAHSTSAKVSIDPRAALCGEGLGSCPSGTCCNKAGQCGTGHSYCSGAGNCQQDFSDACESQQVPSGASLLDLPRPVLGDVPYAKLIQGCTKPGSIAIAFDDGPATNFTDKILDIFASYKMKATFFVTGHDFAKAIDDPTGGYAPILRRMHADGHQIASHTWTHENLTKLTNETQLINQIHYNEMALRNVLGFIPTYFRPTYLQCWDNCEVVMAKLGYHVIMKNLETHDFDNNSPELIQASKDLFVASMQNTTASQVMYITLNHDIRMETAYNLTDFMLNYLVTNNLPKSVTVGECLGDPVENWYRKTPTGPDPALDAPASSTTPDSSTPGTGTSDSSSSTTPDSSTPGTSTLDSSSSTTPKSDSSKLQIGTSLEAVFFVFLAMFVLLI